MRLALLSPLPPDPSRLAHHAAQFRRALNLGGIDVLTPLVGQRPLESLEAARAWVAERDWRGVDVVHAELAPGQRTVYWVLQALARLPHGPALTATVHAPPGLLGQPLHAPFAGVYHARWLPRLTRQASAWLAAPFTRHSDRRLARRLAGVLCTSDASATRLARRLGLPRERITVLPQGLPELACPPLPPGPLKLLCLSGPGQALRPLQDLVAALGQLVAQGGDDLPPWQLTLAGATAASCFEPPRHDPLTRLQADPRLKALGDRIAWQLDPDPQDLPALMAAHHLLVLPERPQPWGLGEAEPGPTAPQGACDLALAVGRPLLVAQQSGQAEQVTSGNGATYTVGDHATLLAVLQDLLTDPDRLSDWATQARRQATSRQWPQMSARYVGFFQQAVARSTRAATK
ncbi:glycosyltransferase [Aquabacterium sp.]|uniref:glycosyltransferase n=1 Tax=Aquabacterium sp. TaxID=1872578 RepID=UPI003D05DF02